MARDGAVRGRRALNILLIVMGQSAQALAFGGISLFLPLIRSDLGLSFSQSGSLAAVSTLVYALLQLPSGYLADRFDPKKLFVVGMLGTNVTSILFALVEPYGWLLAIQAVSGLFRSMIFTPGLLLIKEQFRADRRATAMGVFVAGGFSSSVLLNILGPLLVGPIGWRGLFILFGAVGLVCAALYHRAGQSPHREPGAHATLAELRQLFAHPVLWLTGIIQFVRLSLVLAFTFWLPTYVVVEKGYPLTMAGLIAALSAALTAPSNFIGGWLSDRLHRPLLIIGVSVAVLGLTLVALPFVAGLVPLLLIVGLNAVFIQLYFGPVFAVPMHYLGQRTAGSTAGFGNFCANLGGFALTYALGALKDTTGSFNTGFLVLAAMCVVSLAATVAMSRVKPLEGADSVPARQP
jgi:nitrate/nitrite transporter NarK